MLRAGTMAAGADEEADLSEAFKKQLQGMLVCLVCGPLHRFPSGKCHKSRSKHAMREMTAEERAEEVAWYREIQADGDAARLKQLDKKRRQSRSAKASGGGQEGGSGLAEGAAESSEYVFDFGKHKGKKLMQVWEQDRTYLPHLMNSGLLDARVVLKHAMEDGGIMEKAQDMAKEMKLAGAKKVLARAAAERVEDLHPEVAQLHAIQVEEALVALGQSQPEDPAPLPAVANRSGLRGRKRRRSKGSRGLRTLQHCWACGSVDHKTNTCQEVQAEVRLRALEKQLVASAKEKNKRKARVVTHLKYVNLVQRTAEYDARPAQRSLVPAARGAKALLRMDPSMFTKACIADKLILDLEGHPCVMPGCFRGSSEAAGRRVLGKLTALNDPPSLDVSTKSVWHRCKRCGSKYSVTFGSPLFPKVGGTRPASQTMLWLSGAVCMTSR